MAALTVQTILVQGLMPLFTAPTPTTGDTFANDGAKTFLGVINSSSGDITMTIPVSSAAAPGYTDRLDIVIPPNNSLYLFGPFPLDKSRFAGTVSVVFSSCVNVSIAAIKTG